MDGYQASWEYINQRPMVYPERRYQDPVFMNPENYNWIAQGDGGVARKRLGRLHRVRNLCSTSSRSRPAPA